MSNSATGSYSPDQPTGTGSVSCTQGAGYDLFKNEPLVIDYSLTQPERVDLTITWDGPPFKVMDAVPHVAGSYTFDWDGRHVPTAMILPLIKTVECAGTLLRENHIITTGDTPKISQVKTDPYQAHLSYGQFTRIKYNLTRAADVTVKLISPSGTELTLINGQAQSAGAHEIEWNGLDASDSTEKKFSVSEDGTYTVSIQAMNATTGASSTAKGVLQVRQ